MDNITENNNINENTNNNNSTNSKSPQIKENKGIFSLFKEQTQNFAKGLIDIANTDGSNIFEKIQNKINKDKNKEVREKMENSEWEVKEIEKESLDQGNEKIANRILDVITAEEINLVKLKELCSLGVPPILRSSVWKILLGITPLKRSEHEQKRAELTEEYKRLLLKHYCDSGDESLHHQVYIDIVRTSIHGFHHVFENKNVIEILNRILYLWSKEHSQVNYYQGLNEILAPLLFFYLCEFVDINSSNDLNNLSNQEFAIIEIDCYFSLKQMLDWVLNEYDSTDGSVYAGEMVQEISESVKHNLPALHQHIEKLKLDYNVLCFRWALCLLCREMNILNVGRLFDNYFSMGQSFPRLHPYVCVAILEMFSDKLIPLEFSETIMVLQRMVPSTFSQTRDIDQINPLIKRAFKLRDRDLKRKKVPKGEVTQKREERQQNQQNDEQVTSQKEDKESESTTAILVGGVVLTLFTAALVSHYGRKYLKK